MAMLLLEIFNIEAMVEIHSPIYGSSSKGSKNLILQIMHIYWYNLTYCSLVPNV
jgi:hypothetical protein